MYNLRHTIGVPVCQPATMFYL